MKRRNEETRKLQEELKKKRDDNKDLKQAMKSVWKKHNAQDIIYSMKIQKELEIRDELIKKLQRRQRDGQKVHK